MADAIEPGMWVECVNVASLPGCSGSDWSSDEAIALGGVYRVSDAWIDAKSRPVILIGRERVAASKAHGFRCGYCVSRFRPIRSDITSLERLLTAPVPAELQREPVPA